MMASAMSCLEHARKLIDLAESQACGRVRHGVLMRYPRQWGEAVTGGDGSVPLQKIGREHDHNLVRDSS